MKAKELHELTVDELRQKVNDSKEDFFNLKFQLSTNQLPNTAKLKQLRKDIARIKTVITEKEQKH